MARFEMKVFGKDKIQKMFAEAPAKMTKEAANIIYETVVEIENKAKVV